MRVSVAEKYDGAMVEGEDEAIAGMSSEDQTKKTGTGLATRVRGGVLASRPRLHRLGGHEELLALLADQLDDVAAARYGEWQASTSGGPVADHVEVVEPGQGSFHLHHQVRVAGEPTLGKKGTSLKAR